MEARWGYVLYQPTVLLCAVDPALGDESTVESVREWIVEHKLRTVGCLWLSGIAGSIAHNWTQPTMKTSVKLIHARLIVWICSQEFGRDLVRISLSVSENVIFALALANPLTTPYMYKYRLHAQALALAAPAGAAAGCRIL
ncbi:hypothetical protein Nepgr_001586 [Nepenthes gracilis]|uniref:HIG1 domain-containing protein n=1 Tax=Nepenthes gracilis TaxID=150966 RepID=A0AAD3RW62_NEPGR|nr:hypothetical protein Nepgr_001586 [Nepenthes gracilis]